jgi:hypothetical protein
MRRLLIALYPEAWRRRYAAEISALLEDRPPSLGAMFDLLRGALLAHLHPLSGLRPAERARNSVAGVLGCFICFCFLGSAFAKTTEDHPFQAAGRTHSLLGVSHYAILLAAIGAVAALLLAALPLAGATLGEVRRTRSRELLKLIPGPPLAIGLFAMSVGLLALWLAHNRHDVGVIGALLLAICGLVAVFAASICWLAPRAIMRRIELQRRELALSLPAITAVTLCMLVITVATGVYLVTILLDAPALASGGNGPWQLISTATSISIQLAGMLVLSSVATLSAVRGMRSVRAL